MCTFWNPSGILTYRKQDLDMRVHRSAQMEDWYPSKNIHFHYVSFFVTKVLLVAGGRTGRRMDKDSNTAGYLSSTELYSKQTGKWIKHGELDTYWSKLYNHHYPDYDWRMLFLLNVHRVTHERLLWIQVFMTMIIDQPSVNQSICSYRKSIL